jgi:hypothetical protein
MLCFMPVYPGAPKSPDFNSPDLKHRIFSEKTLSFGV